MSTYLINKFAPESSIAYFMQRTGQDRTTAIEYLVAEEGNDLEAVAVYKAEKKLGMHKA